MYRIFQGESRDKLTMPSHDWVDMWKPIEYDLEVCAKVQGEFPVKPSDAGSQLGSHHVEVRTSRRSIRYLIQAMILDTQSRNGQIVVSTVFSGRRVWSIVDDTKCNFGPYAVGLTLAPLRAPIEGAQRQQENKSETGSDSRRLLSWSMPKQAVEHHMICLTEHRRQID